MPLIGRMDPILQEEDASEWVYRGEGAANLVLSYKGSSPAFIGKVLRVQKALKEELESATKKKSLSDHECLVWKNTQELVASVSQEISGQLYVLHVMGPLLGFQHVDAGVHIPVSKEFLESIEENVSSQRPASRVEVAKINTLCDSALLMSDHTVFPHGNLKEDFCISVEIKISQVSEYDPLDLFSGSRDRIIQALRSLIATPQNNLRVFLNSSFVFGASDTSKVNEPLEDVIKDVILADPGHRLECFLELVTETIIRSGVLARLLSVQKLDEFDIEGAIHAYYNIISQPCKVCQDLSKDLGAEKVSHQYSSMHSLPLKESLRIVREYLIAATAKDCSLMISLRPRKDEDSTAEYSSIVLRSTQQKFEYKAYFVDLDMKPLTKMVHYYELDQEVVANYKGQGMCIC